jgi:hypothetical protein
LGAEERARAEDLFHRLAPLEPEARVARLAEIGAEDPPLAAEIPMYWYILLQHNDFLDYAGCIPGPFL